MQPPGRSSQQRRRSAARPNAALPCGCARAPSVRHRNSDDARVSLRRSGRLPEARTCQPRAAAPPVPAAGMGGSAAPLTADFPGKETHNSPSAGEGAFPVAGKGRPRACSPCSGPRAGAEGQRSNPCSRGRRAQPQPAGHWRGDPPPPPPACPAGPPPAARRGTRGRCHRGSMPRPPPAKAPRQRWASTHPGSVLQRPLCQAQLHVLMATLPPPGTMHPRPHASYFILATPAAGCQHDD